MLLLRRLLLLPRGAKSHCWSPALPWTCGRRHCHGRSLTERHGRGGASVVGADYADAYRTALEEPDAFWPEVASSLVWDRKWIRVIDDHRSPFTKWFPGGEISVCYNAVDRHVEAGRGDNVAIIYDSPVTNMVAKITYKELKEQVSRVAGVLKGWGIRKGDRVIIYMPMIPETIYAMLACSRIGAIHSLVFGGFAAKELAVRINHAKADACLSANFGIEPKRTVPYKTILDEAIRISEHKPKKCLIFLRPGQADIPMTPGRDEVWTEAVDKAQPAECVPIEAMEPLYILYTSGTTGLPKAVVRPAGGHAVNLLYTLEKVYGVKDDDVWWAASDLGWVVGHSYICYAPLLKGVTTVLYEGKPVGTPDASSFFRVVSDHGVCGMFTAPTAMRVIRKEDPEGQLGKKFPGKKLRHLFLAGERCDQETLRWAEQAFGVPTLDNWWQTETGTPVTATCVGLGNTTQVPDEATGLPVPGWNVRVLLEDGLEAAPNQLGNVAIRLPMPPGSMSTLFRADDVFIVKYFEKFPGYYDTMDTGMLHKNGYVSIFSRSDDVINVAGHRLSTSQIEEAIMKHDGVAECAVIGVPDPIKGEVPLALFVLNDDKSEVLEQIRREVIELVRSDVGPVAAFSLCNRVPALPKTRSGKIPRRTISDLARGKAVKIPVTIEDPLVYKAIKAALSELGYARDAPDPK
ncbi:LOW QUALITY PROTEIN: acyl-CoA synthetase short-chain family member 3, mitochondrial-like [Dermacentor silvarum]|uniref:LOW QUALITY PROTEIN: acyl-CoA synthetase short-chain family member 3, mitochondrial-like n=1 Tax=Dermacentor silvarum TaxID=543639 RepID=UPI002100EBAC|nr:LOW QUALITY PROTEIN: acyl-CoA synthetase short-chain family member 3, mitochondrial-like [Dermacentor silvarum]